MIRKAIYQLFLAIDRGQRAPKGAEPEELWESLSIGKDITPNNLKHQINRKESGQVLDAAIPHILQTYETDTKSELSRGIFKAKKLLLAAEILNYSLLKQASNFVAEKAIKEAKKYFVLDVVFQANKIIYNNSRYLKNTKRGNLAIKEFYKYLEYYRIERFLEIEYRDVILKEDKSVSNNIETAHLCSKILDKYQPYLRQVPSFFLPNFIFSLKYLKASHEGDIHEVYKVSKAKTDWYANLSIKFIPGLVHGYSIQIIYCTQTKAFEEGERIADEAIATLPKNTIGYFNFLRVVVKLKLHQGKFNQAIDLVFNTLNHKKFNLLPSIFKRDWLLFEAYVNLLLETGHATYHGRRRRFSIQRFINDLPSFSKDKKAMNIPILIAQMLFFITRKQYNKAIDRIESLGKYNSRYLRNDETFRSMCFIKMILEIPKCSFNRLRVERATEKLHNRLLASEMQLINQPAEIEVIPYERLWEIIIEELRTDHNYTPKKPRIPLDQRGGLRQAQGS